MPDKAVLFAAEERDRTLLASRRNRDVGDKEQKS